MPDFNYLTARGMILSYFVALSVLLSFLYVTGSYPVYGPCRDTLAFTPHERNFTIETTNLTTEITFNSGDAITERNTERFYLTFIDLETNNTEDITLASKRSERLPVRPGATFTIEYSSIESFSVGAGDEIRVIVNGYQQPLPDYCLNKRDRTSLDVVYDRTKIS